MITFPGSPQEILEKFRDQIQNFIDPSGDTWKIMCVSQNVSGTSMPNVSYQSAVLCNQFNERIYEYREITNRLIQIGQRHTPIEKDVTKVCNVFEDMAMLHSEDGLILERHIECYFGAILRAIKGHKMWLQIIKEKHTDVTYNYLWDYLGLDNVHICNDTTCESEDNHEKFDPNAEVVEVENKHVPVSQQDADAIIEDAKDDAGKKDKEV